MPEDNQNNLPAIDRNKEVIHLCPACEDEFSTARARVITALGISISVTPILVLVLQFAGAACNVTQPVDDRILIACLTAWGAIIAYAFKDGILRK